ncbi:MAG: rhodanese-like domain-containing protein [Burkholderiales bacterium]
MNRAFSLSASSKLSLIVVLVAGTLFIATRQPEREFNVRNVSVAEAKSMVEAGALVVDVREEDKFNHRHLPGALLVPVSVLRLGIPATFTYARDKPILVYCGDGVTTGPEGTELLNKAGYTNAVNMEAGIKGWADAGLPVQR